jgi:hypothetical protein
VRCRCSSCWCDACRFTCPSVCQEASQLYAAAAYMSHDLCVWESAAVYFAGCHKYDVAFDMFQRVHPHGVLDSAQRDKSFVRTPPSQSSGLLAHARCCFALNRLDHCASLLMAVRMAWSPSFGVGVLLFPIVCFIGDAVQAYDCAPSPTSLPIGQEVVDGLKRLVTLGVLDPDVSNRYEVEHEAAVAASNVTPIVVSPPRLPQSQAPVKTPTSGSSTGRGRGGGSRGRGRFTLTSAREGAELDWNWRNKSP